MNGSSSPSTERIWSMRSGVHVLPQIITAGSGDSVKKMTNVNKHTRKRITTTPAARPAR